LSIMSIMEGGHVMVVRDHQATQQCQITVLSVILIYVTTAYKAASIQDTLILFTTQTCSKCIHNMVVIGGVMAVVRTHYSCMSHMDIIVLWISLICVLGVSEVKGIQSTFMNYDPLTLCYCMAILLACGNVILAAVMEVRLEADTLGIAQNVNLMLVMTA